MKLDSIHILHSDQQLELSATWQDTMQRIRDAVAAVVWPTNSDRFIINPAPRPNKNGELKNHPNGVVPIKRAFVESLVLAGWRAEQAPIPHVGKIDVVLETNLGVIGVEWETGNISSSHRSLNRLALGLLKRSLVGGILVVPTRKLYRCLTDRVGNLSELATYFDIYRALPLQESELIVVAVEYDSLDTTVPYITKGTDGWALLARPTM